MSDWYELALDLLMGALLGALYFARLWHTIQRFCHEGQPPWVWLLQAILRNGLLLAMFYLLAGGSWQAWLACLGGWAIGRQIMVSRIRPREVH